MPIKLIDDTKLGGKINISDKKKQNFKIPGQVEWGIRSNKIGNRDQC